VRSLLYSAGRFWRTIIHLRPIQLFGRLWFRLPQPQPNLTPAPELRLQTGRWHLPAKRNPSLIGPSTFRFLNETGTLANHGWDDPNKAKLWRYNQHYFDDLNAQDAANRIDWHHSLFANWISTNPPCKGTGWEPYPTSLRIVNWIKWAMLGNSLSQDAEYSLALQARWLFKRLEYHLLGNHLFSNAKALIFAGLFYDGHEAKNWLERGLAILKREVPEQILPDGGQFELSPMYHILAVEDMLDLVNIAERYGFNGIAVEWRNRIPAMLLWLKGMTHPDGNIAFFNDAAFGVAPDNAEILAYANRLGIEGVPSIKSLMHFKDSGFVRMTAGEFVLIADFGRIGPDYLPSHAHADTLSFELSWARQRVFVNSGISEYGTGIKRQRQRGTATHNTVVVANENSSEVWGGFRVGRRARPHGVNVGELNGFLHAQGSHDGYRHLNSASIPQRSFDLSSDGLIINDCIDGPWPAEARYHLHPDVKVNHFNSDGAFLVLPGGQSLQLHFQGGTPRLESTEWHPEFGISKPNICLIIPLKNGHSRINLTSL
jgi:uncharacterized heparinase superfamily protein